MHYRLIAIDLDGTLLGPDGKVSPGNRAAIARAQQAGAIVVPCTGRAWHEAYPTIAGIDGLDRGIFVTGSMVNDVVTGKTIEARPFAADVAARLVELMADLPEAVLVFRDRDQVGHDYLVTGRGELVDNTRWWFEYSKAKVREDRRPADWSHCVRVAVVSKAGALPHAQALLHEAMGEHIVSHTFGGIARTDQHEQVQILEVFPAGVDKWRGVQAVAAHHGVDLAYVAAIGDEINDVSMLRGAACGIAMGNAAELAAKAADHQTRTNAEDGVAFAIDQMLAGIW